MQRCEQNPLISREDIRSSHPALKDVSSVFNPGGIAYQDGFLLLLRIQNRARHTILLKAFSEDGLHFEIDEKPLPLFGLDTCPHEVYHIYDPRITQLDGIYHIITAMDTDKGCFLAWFETVDWEGLHFRGLVSDAEVRNGVLFPQKFGNAYLRLERPNRSVLSNGVKTGSTILCSASPDLKNWQAIAPILNGNPHFWDELIGSGPPPVKTRAGWLHIYHGVATHFASVNIYQAGITLLDLQEPWKLRSRGKYNILEPREIYELTGQVPNVVFPTAMWVKNVDSDGFADLKSPVFIYYGAADTCVCMAQSTIAELLEEVYA